MKFFMSYQYRYSHNQPYIDNMEIERANLPTYKDIQMLERQIAKGKSKENAGTPQVKILCCHPIAG